MIKRFCDKCKKEMTNEYYYGISFLDSKNGRTKYVELCNVCHKDLIDTSSRESIESILSSIFSKEI